MRRHGISLAAGVGFIILLFGAPVSAENVTLALLPPSGNILGAPGSTVGWGYIVTNGTSNWLATLSLSAGSFIGGTPNVIFDFPNIGPNSSITEAFSLITTASCATPPCGLYEFTWDASAPTDTVNSGTFTVSSEYFSGDPSNPASTDLGPAPDASAEYSVTASVPTGTVPEGPTWILSVSGLAAVWLLRRRALFRYFYGSRVSQRESDSRNSSKGSI